MSKPENRWLWRPDWRLWLMAVILFPGLVSLGFWQLSRAAEKQAELDRWEGAGAALEWPVSETPESGLPLILEGYYHDEHQWLLDNRTRDGRAGYEVLQRFVPVDGEALVVNRGWVPAGPSRQMLPEVAAPSDLVRLQVRTAEWPEPPTLADEADVPGVLWPLRVQSLRLERALQMVPVSPIIVRLEDDSQPGALVTDWQPQRMGPETHRGYAVQWFALATALLCLTVGASFRREKEDNTHNEQ